MGASEQMRSQLRLAAVVLAAGAGSRFSVTPAAKLLAELEGRPILEHVLSAVRGARLASTVVVLGHGGDSIEKAISWAGEDRVRNRHPEEGLSSSIRVGIAELESRTEDLDGAFIVLGDQPLLRTAVLRELARHAAIERPADRLFVVPHYGRASSSPTDDGPRNPVLLLRPAWLLLSELSGDRGLASVMDAHPDEVLVVPVDGSMPDVDTHADLAALS